MSKQTKIHCEDQNNSEITNCGRVERFVMSVDDWVFDKLKEKHKCKRCAKREATR